MQNADGKGFERWLQRRREREATDPTTDQMYERYLDAAEGRTAQRSAGRTHPQIDGGPEASVGMTDDQLYAGYRAELSGEASRRRAEEAARQERLDRAAEHRRHAREQGYPEPSFYED